MRFRGIFPVLCFLLALPGMPSRACTIVMASGQEVALAGSNEDSFFPLTLLWITPASEGSYARITLGYKLMGNSVQGGMNQHGLFVDGNSLPSQGWVSDPAKKRHMGPLLDQLLAKCATLEEVKDFFRTYNVPGLDQARIPVMDRSGASMVVEWYGGKVVFLESGQPYQVATNFVGSAYAGREKPCWRYKKAVALLEQESTYSLKTVIGALDASHQENEYARTVYSFICDLKKGEVLVYNYHDFSRPVKFSLTEELPKGAQEHYLGQLFPQRTPEFEEFLEVGPVKMIEMGLSRNPQIALMFFHQLKKEYPIAYGREISIQVLSQAARPLMEHGQAETALVFLKRNADEFPDAPRSHLELAEAYLALHQNEEARKEYEKVLALDPGHKQAQQALEDMVRQ